MIYIGEKYRIWADTYNVNLEEFRKPEPKKGKEENENTEPRWFHVGFYNTFSGACVRILRDETNKIEANNVKDFLNEMNKIKDTIVNATSHIEVLYREESKRGRKSKDEEGGVE